MDTSGVETLYWTRYTENHESDLCSFGRVRSATGAQHQQAGTPPYIIAMLWFIMMVFWSQPHALGKPVAMSQVMCAEHKTSIEKDHIVRLVHELHSDANTEGYDARLQLYN